MSQAIMTRKLHLGRCVRCVSALVAWTASAIVSFRHCQIVCHCTRCKLEIIMQTQLCKDVPEAL